MNNKSVGSVQREDITLYLVHHLSDGPNNWETKRWRDIESLEHTQTYQ